jgi:hypothetical protein
VAISGSYVALELLGGADDFALLYIARGRAVLTRVSRQTLLQTITPSVDVSSTQAVVFTPDPSIGPNGNE